MKRVIPSSHAAIGLLTSALLAACGGGSEPEIPAGINAAAVNLSPAVVSIDPSVDSADIVAPTAHVLAKSTNTSTSGSSASTIILSNLPAATTTQTSTSIGYRLDSSSGTYPILCRRDAYTPIACPNPFTLGVNKPLVAGSHTVDFYINKGVAIDLTKPDASYAWTIVANADSTESTSSSAVAPTVTLSNLPAATTTQTSASIAYQLNSSASAYSVQCRRDGFAPIACPNPFVLGATSPLSAGSHTVDYYIDKGTGIDVSKPDASYGWTVSATTPEAPALAPAPSPAPSPSISSAAALGSLPYPVRTTIQGTGSPMFGASDTVTGYDGTVRLAAATDPGGSGKQVYLHRIARVDANVSGTAMNASVRSEKVWIDTDKYLLPGNDYWFSFAFRPKSGEWPAKTSTLSDDEFIVFQTHSESNGATQPDIALFVDAGRSRMYWQKSYSAATQATTPQGVSVVNSQALPPLDVWQKFVVHYRPGFTSAHSPRLEIWQATGSGAYTKIVDDSTLNTYNWNTGSYPRIGFYKWAGTNWSGNYPTIASHLTTLYMGQGADYYGEAVAALAGL